MRFRLVFVLTPLLLDSVIAKGAGGAIGKILGGLKGGKGGKDPDKPSVKPTEVSTGVSPTDTGSVPKPKPKDPCNVPGASTIVSCSITSSATVSQSTCASLDTACNNCAQAAATIRACSTAVPDWIDVDDTNAAKCLCYNPSPSNASSYIWVPNQFDQPFSDCPVWASTGDPSNSLIYSSLTNFCDTMSNVLSATSTDTATIALDTITGSGQLSSVLATGTAVGGLTASITASPSAMGTSEASDILGVPILGLVWASCIVILLAL